LSTLPLIVIDDKIYAAGRAISRYIVSLSGCTRYNRGLKSFEVRNQKVCSGILCCSEAVLRIFVIILFIHFNGIFIRVLCEKISYSMITSFPMGSRRETVYIFCTIITSKKLDHLERTKWKSIKIFNFFYHDTLTLKIWILHTR